MTDEVSPAALKHEPNRPTTMTCPRCGVPAQQIWGELVRWGEGYFTDDGERVETDDGLVPVEWWYSACQACEQSTVWRGNRIVYPLRGAVPPAHPMTPDEVKRLYAEASAVLPISRRAGAALVRAALEKLIKELDEDAKGKDRLDDRIARLKYRVSEPLGKLLDVVRFLGNESLHGDGKDELVELYLGELDDGIAELMFGAINDLVDELVARPETVQGLWKRLPEGVRKTIEEKEAAAAQR